MSSIVIFGNTSGSITLDTPAVAGTNTLLLPASTGTVMVADGSGNVSITGNASVAGNLSFNSGYGSSAVAYGCRAWVNFNGTGTPAIRASGNVNSITDNGTGDYTINFTTAMPDANYGVSMTSDFSQSIMKSAADWGAAGTNPTTTAVRMFTRSGGSVASDCNFGYVAIFR
jgi:hypothetical protein